MSPFVRFSHPTAVQSGPPGRHRAARALKTFAATAAMTSVVIASAASTASADAVPSSPLEPMQFTVNGSAEVRTGIRGRVAIAGSFTGSYDRATGKFAGGFSLTPTRANVVVLGILPVVAETDWIFTEPVTGEWRDGIMRMRIAARIKHPHLFAFGTIPIAGGGRCATREPSLIELRSGAGAAIADPLAGGMLSTEGKGFAIGALAGCGWLDGLLSAVAAGGGNQATLELTPPNVKSN